MKSNFPFEHVVKYDTKEIWVVCNSSITAMGLPTLVEKFYPGYCCKIATKEYLETLKNKLAN